MGNSRLVNWRMRVRSPRRLHTCLRTPWRWLRQAPWGNLAVLVVRVNPGEDVYFEDYSTSSMNGVKRSRDDTAIEAYSTIVQVTRLWRPRGFMWNSTRKTKAPRAYASMTFPESDPMPCQNVRNSLKPSEASPMKLSAPIARIVEDAAIIAAIAMLLPLSEFMFHSLYWSRAGQE